MKNFFGRIWQTMLKIGWVTIAIWVLVIGGLVIFLAIRDTDNESTTAQNESSPEIAQVYEPSIGAPLPADTPGETSSTTTETDWSKVGQVAGDSTATSSNNSTNETPTGPKPYYVAPNTGVDPNKPISYLNSNLKFTATLPAGTNVDQKADRIAFTSKQGSLLYIVSTSNAGNENLQSIESQLRNSSGTSNIAYEKFAGQSAIKFSSKDFDSGIAFLANGKIYYLFGNSQNFATFKLL